MRPSPTPVLGRPLVFFTLFGLFLLVFVVTPLWTRFTALPARGAALALLTLSGLAWAWVSSGSVPIRWKPVLPYFLLFLVIAAALNARALAASIPWRGDEDHHIFFAWDLARALAERPWYLALPLLPLVLGGWQRTLGWKTLAGALALAVLAPLLAVTAHLDMDPYDVWYHILRYPILLKYVTAAPVYLYSLLPGSPPPEIPYRILPLISAAALSTFAACMLRKQPLWLRLAAGLLVLTLPLVRYYSTIFYLEMPAVLCMAWAAFHADRLLRAEPDRLMAMPAWYALLLVGFIKETTLPFLAAFAVWRILTRLHILRNSQTLAWPAILGEAKVLYGVCLPLFLYLFFRTHAGNPRPAGLWLNNLRDLQLPLRLAQSLLACFGVLLPLALAGAILMIRRHQFTPLLFLASSALLSAALHYLDDYSYIGYSRFNLFLLPSVLALAWTALRLGAQHRRAAAGLLLSALVAINALLSPVFADGSKKPLWGIYGVDTAEHYYPYREALGTLRDRHAGQKTLLTGHYYGYLARFYTGIPQWPVQQVTGPAATPTPADESRRIDSTLAAASQAGYQAVLYHVLGREYHAPENLHGYGNSQVFRNSAHTLVLFSR